ncbi:FAD-NAD(P)-binding protein [Acetobacter sacchari]|uniref:FAD-NAD(P)-binding protein n=1 Tax=Acetobacter sacchari TaxID=2661687 RepID=A0ABS3LWC3_9PROT|nr:FAD-NAD(P)-binding protein [Acetobacter sacchari]MBO1360204.1 FAD-NAD(P)-binding protein [Acetobacter sacchari]
MPESRSLKRVAIIGAGPTGLYTFFSLLKADIPFEIVIYEQALEAGVGMPYSDEENLHLMLANIASIEIPPLTCTYLDWLRRQSAVRLARYNVDMAELDERQFLPRILLGEYFRDQFLALVQRGKEAGFQITVNESCQVTDLEEREHEVRLWAECHEAPVCFDLAIVATGHVWPDEDQATRSFFPSPWSGLLDAHIPACKVGIIGTSLSAIDAAMAVAIQHGRFVEEADDALRFEADERSQTLSITLMSRSGILPEADFYCPIPYEPLQIATPAAISHATADGPDGLLDRVFTLMAREIKAVDPHWSARIGLRNLDADSFADAYFEDRHSHDAFRWSAYNLKEVECNKREGRTVNWRYAILRLHEAVQDVVPLLTDSDRRRFDVGLARVFVDNYSAIPSESIRRLLALQRSGIIHLLELGLDYTMDRKPDGTTVNVGGVTHVFRVLIDARGQKPLKTENLPFGRLRRQLLAAGESRPIVDEDYFLKGLGAASGRIALGALPYLMHDRPFIQGITASAKIGSKIGNAALRVISARQDVVTISE